METVQNKRWVISGIQIDNRKKNIFFFFFSPSYVLFLPKALKLWETKSSDPVHVFFFGPFSIKNKTQKHPHMHTQSPFTGLEAEAVTFAGLEASQITHFDYISVILIHMER